LFPDFSPIALEDDQQRPSTVLRFVPSPLPLPVFDVASAASSATAQKSVVTWKISRFLISKYKQPSFIKNHDITDNGNGLGLGLGLEGPNGESER
jgi:hypothetical protein